MPSSLIELQRNVIVRAVQIEPRSQWRYVLLDAQSKLLVESVVDMDRILDQNISAIEEIESKRTSRSDFEAVYILSPLPHVVDCLISDFNRPKPRYAGAHILWTTVLSDELGSKIARTLYEVKHQDWIRSERTLPINFFSRESHVFTFRDPKQFFPFYHPGCDDLSMHEFRETAKKILAVCATLNEFPVIRYFRSPHLTHRARQLPQMLASFVQRELENYQSYMRNVEGEQWPPEDKTRPRGVLFIVDRSMDPYAPLLHEFTYQAMAHDLLPIRDDDKVTYTADVEEATGTERKEMEITEEDKVWTNVRHKHMTETIAQLMADFEKFRKDNPNFSNVQGANTVFAIKEMLANLPQFAEMKAAYSLHLTMAQDCMNIFQHDALPDTAELEQNLAVGLDSNNDKLRGVTDQLVRLLDSPTTQKHNDRLRLIILYLLWRDGLLGPDIEKLCKHAQIQGKIRNALSNLDLIGARVVKRLKDPLRPGYKKPPVNPPPVPEGQELSRYVTEVKRMLEEHVKGTLDPELFPFSESARDPGGLNAAQEAAAAASAQQASLRTAKPTWTRQRLSAVEPRQRVIVFMAGGATFSEARSCYEVSQQSVRDVYLGSSHMITPDFFLEQLSLARADRRELKLEADIPPEMRPKAPSHLFEPDPVPRPPAPTKSASTGNVRPGVSPNPSVGSVGSNGGLSASTSSFKGPTQIASSGRHSPGRLTPQPSGGSYDKEKKSKKRYFGLK